MSRRRSQSGVPYPADEDLKEVAGLSEGDCERKDIEDPLSRCLDLEERKLTKKNPITPGNSPAPLVLPPVLSAGDGANANQGEIYGGLPARSLSVPPPYVFAFPSLCSFTHMGIMEIRKVWMSGGVRTEGWWERVGRGG